MFTGFTRARYSHASAALIGALAVVTGVAAGPAMAQGSASDMRAGYLADFDTMQTKFKELAGAMDADTYGWRPMDGVRSVSEVFMLIAAENYFVPAAWGATPPDGITPSFALFDELAEVTDKRDVLNHLETSAAYLLEAVGSLSDEQMQETIQMFGQDGVLQASLLLVVGDMHEHLGQAIAYARMNEVVPPWTARQGQ
ncbi:MAG: DinB family protein [Acidobacteria bacterium]|nr:DinB family protein [Acidobacteriota bacterium]